MKAAFELICSIYVDDGIEFSLGTIEPIREDDRYGGFRVSLFAKYGKINAPMSMDVSTGDAITPEAAKREYTDLLDENVRYELWAYPIETVLAEKAETILSRGTDNTRPRDFYDVYMLSALEYDKKVFSDAYTATAKHRGSYDKITDYNAIIAEIGQSRDMQRRWELYTKQMPYAEGISFDETLNALINLLE